MCRNANPDKNSTPVKVPRRSVERTADAVEGSSDAVERPADAVERHVDAVDAALKQADAVETRSTPVVAAVVSSFSGAPGIA